MAFPDSFKPGLRLQLSIVYFFWRFGLIQENEKSWFNIISFIKANCFVFVERLREVALKMGGT